MSRRMIVGISGASGAIYGLELLKLLRKLEVESHLVISKSAALTIKQELSMSLEEVQNLADVHYAPGDIGAAIASGSYHTMGMIVAPCSMKTLGELASGVTHGLLSRAADVTLKERRKLVLMVRETPLHSGHLQNMLHVSQIGGIIAPPVPAFYNHPTSLHDMVMHSLGRVLDLFSLESQTVTRWQGMQTQ